MEPLLYLSVLAGALLLDTLVGDPPSSWHPVGWIGRLIQATSEQAPSGRRARLLFGSGMVLAGALLTAGCLILFERFVPLDHPVGWLLHTVLLKLSFSFNGLRTAGQRVHRSLAQGDLEAARRHLGWDLVSRPTEALTSNQVAAATIESLSENLTDSLAAPLLAYALGGLPAAWAYRFINTADAMVGYRTVRYEQLGKAAAMVDDWLNWLPARLSSVFILVGSVLGQASLQGAWQALMADRGATASPNAGWTMAAAGGALGVRLEKVGHYTLNTAGRAPAASDLERADQLLVAAAACTLAAVAALGVAIRGF